MAPTGVSFANLAYSSGKTIFQNEEWLQQNLEFFHALELKSILPAAEMHPARKILSELGSEELLSMTSEQVWIGSESYILTKKKSAFYGDSQSVLPAVDYLVYHRSDWDRFLSHYGIETRRGQTVGCAYREDGLCWVKSYSQEKKMRWTFGVLFFLAISLIAFCVVQIVRHIKDQNLQEERKRFALQALTHELRTPLASLVVSSEQLLNDFDMLPVFSKEPFLRMVDDVQRLTRVAESSRNYLKVGDAKGIVSFNFVKVPSINEFVTSVLARYSDEITMQELEQDQPYILDQYWVGVCLQNLVQNALQHGVKPVVVRVFKKGTTLVFSVSDSGKTEESDLKDVLKPFFKRPKSSGLGLGLTIVQTVMTAMGSKLKISSSPTRFELWIEGTHE